MYDREDERKICLDLIKQRSHFRLHGPRRVGKTTVLKMIKDEISSDVVLFNCQTGYDSPQSIINGLAQACGIPERHHDIANSDNWMESGDTLINTIRKDRTGIIVIIDEFSTVLSRMDNKDNTLSTIFLDWFVKHLDSRDEIIFIIAGSISFETVIDGYAYSRQLKKAFPCVYVNPFDKLIAKGFIISILKEKGIEISGEMVDMLHESIVVAMGENGLFPVFIREFTEHIIDQGLENVCNAKYETDDDMKAKISNFIAGVYSKVLEDIVKQISKGTNQTFPLILDYFNAMLDDVKRVIPNYETSNKRYEIAELFQSGVQKRQIGLVEARLMGSDTLEILDSLVKIYVTRKDENCYYFDLKFLYDIWIKLYPSVELGRIR
ncbi:MAG: AAA family ATPase [Candidatus Peribacteraceae bacterium]|nr:AAA family ATPase [Candidatus Peribacteraceae bacterium]